MNSTLIRTALMATAAGAAALALASPASAGSFNRHLLVGCPGTSQDCPARQGLNVSTDGPLFFTFTADPNPPACAPGRARMFIDGNEWGGAVQPGANDGGYYADVALEATWSRCRWTACRAAAIPAR